MNYLFYDYETSGRSRAYDQIYQFGAIRADKDFNEIGEPIEFFCKPRLDVIPSPYAVKVNSIDLEELDGKGLSEFEFAKAVSEALVGDGNQCIVGYNSKTFDNNFTRFLFYRNFHDAYSWSWADGNSTFDILDLSSLGFAHNRIPGIITRDESGPSLRLERLSLWNGFEHENAHDAISDVRATIQLAKLIKAVNPKLFEFALSLQNRDKARRIMVDNDTFLHSSTLNGYERGLLSLNAFVSPHPTLRHSIISWNLLHDPREILQYSAEEIQGQMYAKKGQRKFEVGFDEFKANHCPMVSPLTENARALVMDLELCLENKRYLDENREQMKKLAQVVFDSSIPEVEVDADLYAGNYFAERDADAGVIADMLNDPPALERKRFQSIRFQRQHLRLIARNFADSLTIDEAARFEAFCREKLKRTDEVPWMTTEKFKAELKELRLSGDLEATDDDSLARLEDYVSANVTSLE